MKMTVRFWDSLDARAVREVKMSPKRLEVLNASLNSTGFFPVAFDDENRPTEAVPRERVLHVVFDYEGAMATP